MNFQYQRLLPVPISMERNRADSKYKLALFPHFTIKQALH